MAHPRSGDTAFSRQILKGLGLGLGFYVCGFFLLVLGYIPSCYDVTLLFIALDLDPEPIAVLYLWQPRIYIVENEISSVMKNPLNTANVAGTIRYINELASVGLYIGARYNREKKVVFQSESTRSKPCLYIAQSVSSHSLQIGSDLPLLRTDPTRDLRLALLAQTQPLTDQVSINHASAAGAVALNCPEGTGVQSTGMFDRVGQLRL